MSREARIEAKLEKAGLKPELARCMAHRLDTKLSDAQLEQLAAAAKAAPGDDASGGHHHKLGALTARLRAIDDPQIVDVVTRAGIGCTILG